jgi:putative hydrolase of the HAD superfamily
MSDRLAFDPDLVLFDLDDTLCDSRLALTRRLRFAFELAAESSKVREGLDFDTMVRLAIELEQHGSDHFASLFERFGIAGSTAVEIAQDWITENRLHGLEYFHDALETLDAVRAARPDRRIGVITNGPAWIQRPKVELLGIEKHVDFVIISGEFGVHKPDPSIFREGLRLGSAGAHEAVFIGDSIENDIGGAHGVGMTAIWMNLFDLPWPEEIPPPHHVATDLAEVRRLLM